MEPSVKLQYACGGIVVAGLLYVILAAVIKLVGVRRSCASCSCGHRPIIILIGLNLAPNAVSNASSCWWLALLSIAVIVAANIWGKGMVKIIPILLGVVIPYLVAVAANALGATRSGRLRLGDPPDGLFRRDGCRSYRPATLLHRLHRLDRQV